MVKFSKDEKNLLSLLRGEAIAEESSFEMIKQLANRHAIMPLLGDILWKDQDVYRISMRTISQYYHLLFKTKYYVGLLRESGIETVILKGFPVAQYYPIPQLRKSGDIDLLLLNTGDIDRAVEVLEQHGVRRMSTQHANYHVAMISDEQIEIELHLSMTEELDSVRMNHKLSKLQGELKNHVVQVEILENSFPVLSPGYQAFSLLLHMLHHFMRSGFGLKLLLDWTYFWNHGMEKSERKIYRRLIREFGLSGFSEMISSACFFELGLDDSSLIGTRVSEETARQFLKDVLSSHEFGGMEDHQMVAMRGTRLWDYIREFHHQMHINYPRAGAVFIIWPVLWIMTYIRFSVNNHTVRSTSLFKVLKSARERSSYLDEIQLFRR